ncbi:serine/threonine protein kinase [Phytophthora nicotianae P1569]|uniref:Serine/threonine protein kinase n=1 Tax=Phytophthora nicotianae P1569 TaxID=1317065 RepID=V9FVF6_PHYNI|nr:serine/threonine protein kinase [Phytophthora nicotianae P1569]
MISDLLFRVRRQLSPAMYGEVVECELPDHDDPVAAKCISLARAADARARVQGTREIDNPFQEQRVAALLAANGGHRNVVQPYYHFIRDQTLYLVSELCGDGDLHSLVAAKVDASTFLTKQEVLSRMHQVLQGVYYLHTVLGIAHRDLSLENVLLSRGVCKITDFGLSTDARIICDSGQVGKEYYMAPEIVAGERYDPALADVWSLGIMWFIMLTGSPLLTLASPSMKGFKAVAEHGVGAVIVSWGHSKRISTSTISLLEKMLQIDPHRRISLGQVLTDPVFAKLKE